MKKNFIPAMIIAVALSVSAVSAQTSDMNKDAAMAQIQANLETVSARLNLTEDQKPEVEAILRDSMEQRLSILKSFGFEDGNRPNLRMLQKRDLRNQLQAVSEDTRTKLAGVLSDDQMAEYIAFQEEQSAAMREQLQDK